MLHGILVICHKINHHNLRKDRIKQPISLSTLETMKSKRNDEDTYKNQHDTLKNYSKNSRKFKIIRKKSGIETLRKTQKLCLKMTNYSVNISEIKNKLVDLNISISQPTIS